LPEKALKPDGTIDWGHMDTDIEHDGYKITLPGEPGKMPLREAIKVLKRKADDEETEMSVHEVIDAFPLDGAVAFMLALKAKYGWASPIPTPGFFGPEPPQMITVDIGPDPKDKIQVPWGQFMIPGIENPVTSDATKTEFGWSFVIYGELRKKEVHILKDLADLTREIVAKRSIYRSKALRLKMDSSGELNFRLPPAFIKTSHVKPDELILSKPVQDMVNVNIWTLIRHTEACLEAKIPLKRGVLLEGPYGTGKSMTALVTAKHAVENGWTFITIDKADNLSVALEFAKRYEPAVLFCEDIDRYVAERNDGANQLMNTLDGVLSKDSRIIVVLTTNHVDKVTQGMLRPGRLDAVITVTPPDAEAVGRLIRLYGRDKLEKNITLERIGEKLAGAMPAVIREVTERSKLAMVSRGAKKLSEDDLIVSADSMSGHRQLLGEKKQEAKSPEQELGEALAKVLVKASGNVVVATGAAVAGEVRNMAAAVIENDDTNTKKVVTKLNAAAGAAKTATLEPDLKEALKNVDKRTKKAAEQLDEIHDATV
jgi:transitional endoplasmic reticulum ATPase